ncbi:phenylacetate--CoA ligase family protein [Caloramator sp. E03]|uniref:phenylacetate--CoA ligase family protein n=1 Tax=Caloramator sp. E03 TaxID=2576307 RepID=UPI00111055AE|nr:phenylacetate--CoA ligase family protein [Caloramator sp. E03]QCX34376.1 phenylacetate--CoA ligase family protein [Caloramator sp. E03]
MKNIINKIPPVYQQPIRFIYYSLPDKIRYGRDFRDFYNFLDKSQYWDKSKLQEYQIHKIKEIIQHAYNTVPYYYKLFNEYGIKPNAIQDFDDYKKIPYLTKEIIQNNLKELVSNNYKNNNKNLLYVTTGGSTGIPTGFYIDKKFELIREWAFVTHIWKRVGYDINKVNKCVILRGNIPFNGLYEYKNRELILSSYKLTEENMINYINLINKFNPDFIQAYPSSIYILSNYINENKIIINCKNLKCILCASENLYEFQRKEIENAFNVKVFSFYGHTEHACIGGECEYSNYYHLQSEYGYTELINENGQEVTEEDEIGEIVATGFNNYVVPFIRYKTMDLAVNTNKTCTCGRNYKLIKKVEGRLQELLITFTGRYISMTAINMHSNIFDNVQQFQFYQDTPGVCIFNIVKKPNYTEKDEKIIYRELKKKLGDDMQLIIKYVDNIPRTKSGKYRFLIQKLDIKYGDR